MQINLQAKEARLLSANSMQANPPVENPTAFCQRIKFPGLLPFYAALAALLLAMAASAGNAQLASAQTGSATPTAIQAQVVKQAKPASNSDRRRAAKLYLASSKLFAGEHFEEAMRGYEKAAALDPENDDYPLAASVARSHTVAALIQAAARTEMRRWRVLPWPTRTNWSRKTRR
jgi:tetratricopeptide (TPR) repeat protein